VLPVEIAEPGADLRRRDPAERLRCHLDHGDGGAALAGDGGGLEADEPRADDGDAGTGSEPRAERQGVVDVADVKDVETVGARRAQLARPRAGREKEEIVGLAAAVLEAQPACAAIDLADPCAEAERNVVLAIPGLRPDIGLLDLHGAGEQLLGERWTLIGRMALLADQQDLALEAGAAQGLRGAATGMAGADDDDPRLRTHRNPLWLPVLARARGRDPRPLSDG